MAESNKLSAKLECNLMVLNGVLNLEIRYNSKAHSIGTVTNFKRLFFENLTAVLSHIGSEDNVYFTPSDFDAVEINQEELDFLFE